MRTKGQKRSWLKPYEGNRKKKLTRYAVVKRAQPQKGKLTSENPPLRGNERLPTGSGIQKEKEKRGKDFVQRKNKPRAVMDTAADIAYSELVLEVELELSEGGRGSSDTGDAL